MLVVLSGAVTEMAAGQSKVPSKWPQKPLASMVSQNQILKTAQFVPLLSILGTEEGRVLDKDVTVTVDMVSTRFHKYKQS